MTDPHTYLLGGEESERIFSERIAPLELHRGRRQEKPTVVFVVAQHGSGKTATSERIMHALDKRGGSVVLDNDKYKPFHPRYRDLMSRDGEFATLATAADGQRWGRMAAEYVRANRFDALIEETVQNPPYFREQVEAWRAAGYRVEAAIMAVPESFSRLGVLDRYQKQVEEKGAGRLPSDHKQQLAYAGVAEVAAMIDREKLVDTVSVWNRDNAAVYLCVGTTVQRGPTDGGDARLGSQGVVNINATAGRGHTSAMIAGKAQLVAARGGDDRRAILREDRRRDHPRGLAIAGWSDHAE